MTDIRRSSCTVTVIVRFNEA